MKHRTLSTVALAACASVILAGCATGGGAAPETAETPEAATSTAEAATEESAAEEPAAPSGAITVWSWDVAATGLTRLAEEYMASHPGTTIEVVDVGYDNTYDKIAVGLQSGAGLPDLMTVESDRMPGYVEKFPEGFVDLTETLGDTVADFDPSKIAAASDAAGHLFAVPWDSGTMALFVRADYLADAGVDPASITTWDDFVTAAQQVKDKTGHTAFDTDLSTGAAFIQLLQQRGSGIFDADGNIIVNGPEAAATLEFLQDLNAKGLLNNVKGWDGRVSAAKEGSSAFSPNAVWWIGTLKADAADSSGKWIVQPLPVFTEGGAATSNNGGSNLVIPAQAQNAALAADFAKFALANADSQNSMMVQEGLFPSYLPALEAQLYSEKDAYFSDTPVLETFAQLTSQIPPIYYTGDFAAASEIVANATVSAILNGENAQEALDAAADAIAQQTGRSIG